MNKKDNSGFQVAREDFADSTMTVSATAIGAIRTEPRFYEKRGSCVECGDGFMNNETVYCVFEFTDDGGHRLSGPQCSDCAGY